MLEQFERTLQVLRDAGLLDRCTRISAGDITVTMRPSEPERGPAEKRERESPRQQLCNELKRAFPNAAIPRSLREA